MPIALVAAAVTAGATVYGASKASSAAKNAAKTTADAATQANDLQKSIYDSNVSLLNPAISGGNAARSQLQGILNVGGDASASDAAFQNYLKSTGYQFETDQGIKAVTGNKAASHSLDSGATLKALQTYGQNTAAKYLGDYEDHLGALSQQGTAAGGALAGVGTGYANTVGANIQNAANTTANAGLVSANQTNSLIGSGIGALGQYLGANQYQSSYAKPTPALSSANDQYNWDAA